MEGRNQCCSFVMFHLHCQHKRLFGKYPPKSFRQDQEKEKQQQQTTTDGTVDLFGGPAVKCKTGGWSTSSYILGAQGFAAMGYFGVSTNLILYLTKGLHEGNAFAANNVSNWTGTSYVTSFIGGFLGDAYWGRYWTTGIFLIIYLLGMVLLTLTATISALKPPRCVGDLSLCHRASPEQTTILYVALYIVAFGYGGYRPCLVRSRPVPEEQKQATAFLNWCYLSVTFGTIISPILIVYIEDNISWGLGFGLSTVAVAISVAMFFLL